MATAMTLSRAGWPPLSRADWRDVVLPKEHGSWSLAFEPLALGLLCAPSVAGGAFGLAVAAGFFCRRPLRIAWRETRVERRPVACVALAWCAGVALAAFAATVALGGVRWLPWLLPTLACGAIFAVYDVRNDGREEVAEIAGTTAFAALPAVLAALAGWGDKEALTLAAIMLGRALPTVVFVRAAVRGRKTGRVDFDLSIGVALLAFVGAVGLAAGERASWIGAAWGGFFLARILVVRGHPGIRPKQLGIFEAVSGVAFVVTTALCWR